jgi:carbonic anhydrase/acetyltransferase-like protein (isoleucine patch superfamily)
MTEHLSQITVRATAGRTPSVVLADFIAPGARVLGEVRLSEGSSIWFNAVLRADGESIDIGRGSNLQDGVTVHTDPGFPVHIGADVSVGHNAVLHGCRIGDATLIGMGAVVLNGARIGAECLVAAGAVVLEGIEIPGGSLVAGVPAKIRRPLTEEERAGIRENARTYRRLAQEHSASSSPPILSVRDVPPEGRSRDS